MKTKILMVCLGNICRSPMAEGLLRKKIQDQNLDAQVDSAGTSGFHIGEKPDRRAQKTMESKGISISDLRGRQFDVEDFDSFDLIYAMDESNYQNILQLCRNEDDKRKVQMILNEIYPGSDMPVPDPYWGGDQGFEDVFNLLNEATDRIAKKI